MPWWGLWGLGVGKGKLVSPAETLCWMCLGPSEAKEGVQVQEAPLSQRLVGPPLLQGRAGWFPTVALGP